MMWFDRWIYMNRWIDRQTAKERQQQVSVLKLRTSSPYLQIRVSSDNTILFLCNIYFIQSRFIRIKFCSNCVPLQNPQLEPFHWFDAAMVRGQDSVPETCHTARVHTYFDWLNSRIYKDLSVKNSQDILKMVIKLKYPETQPYS